MISPSDYKAILQRIEELIAKDPQESSPTFEELNYLGTLVSEYEDIRFPIEIQ